MAKQTDIADDKKFGNLTKIDRKFENKPRIAVKRVQVNRNTYIELPAGIKPKEEARRVAKWHLDHPKK